MKCAIEIYAINKFAQVEKEMLAERERLRKEEERKRLEQERKAKVIESTIDYCENKLSDLMIEEANKGNNIFSLTLPVKFNDWEHEEFMLISEVKREHEFNYWEQASVWMDSKTFFSYLREHCFSVTIHGNAYRCWNGYYFTDGADIIITIDPECLN